VRSGVIVKQIPLHDYAASHPELKATLDKFGKART